MALPWRFFPFLEVRRAYSGGCGQLVCAFAACIDGCYPFVCAFSRRRALGRFWHRGPYADGRKGGRADEQRSDKPGMCGRSQGR